MAKGTLALRQIQLGDNADTSKNFVISVPAVADGTLVIERGNGTDVLSIAADGKINMPSLAFTKDPDGTLTLPNGFILKWGTTVVANNVPISFPEPFPTACVLVNGNMVGVKNQLFNPNTVTESAFLVQAYVANTGIGVASGTLRWWALGY